MNGKESKLKYILMVLFGATCYGILSIFTKLAYGEGFTLGEITFYQTFLGTISLWTVVYCSNFFRKRSKIYKPEKKTSRKDLLNLLLAGIPTGFGSIFYYKSIQEVSVSMAIILLFQFVWMGTLFECIIERKLPNRSQILSIILLIVGTILAADVLNGGLGKVSISGITYGLLSALAYAIFNLINGSLATTVNPKKRSALMFTGSLVFLSIIYPPTFMTNPQIVIPLFKYALAIALLSSVIPPICFSTGIPKIGLGLASILASVELPSAIIAATLVLGEKTSFLQWVGVIIILAGVIYPIWLERKNN